MNKLTKWAGLFAAVCMTATVFSVAGCGDEGESVTMYTVDFESNGGSEVESQKVEEGGKVEVPADPTKENYIFGGWYKEETLENIYSFETETVTSDITLYAGWDSASDTSVANFYWNYEGAPEEIYVSKTFANGSRIPYPGTPERDGFVFGGWYTEDGSEQYSDMKKYEGEQNFYAKWQEIFTFEAEDTQLTGITDPIDIALGLATEGGAKKGSNFSGPANGVDLIKSDAGASGGKYVSGLFYKDAYLQFEIEAETEVKGATLRLVLSCEYADIMLDSDSYVVTVNDTAINFDEFRLGNGADISTEPGIRGGWKEVYINNIDLKAGQNFIRLTVNNSETPAGEAGTVDAASPSVDCIKIYADSKLTMTEYENK